jgi:hypothetical protein
MQLKSELVRITAGGAWEKMVLEDCFCSEIKDEEIGTGFQIKIASSVLQSRKSKKQAGAGTVMSI